MKTKRLPRFSAPRQPLLRLNVEIVTFSSSSACKFQDIHGITHQTPFHSSEKAALKAMKAHCQRLSGVGRVSLLIAARSAVSR